MNVLLYSIATWRLTRMMIWEEGPGEIFTTLQNYAESREEEKGDWIARGLQCHKCLSVWIGAIFTLLDYAHPALARLLALPLAASAVEIWMHKFDPGD